jgi:hypothetical protein
MTTTPITIRNYKQVTEIFREICLSQESVKQFQLGVSEDLDVENAEHTFQRFPLVFMIPQPSTMDRFGKMILAFSFIVADIVKDNDEYLTIDTHNNTLMIMQDIFSKFIMTDWATVPLKIQTPITMVPFQERFNNNLSGWAAEINVEVQNPFDLCNAAFN